jgi:hypothetical protein
MMDEPSFFHQWQSDALLEQYTEQQIAVAFGQGEVDHAVAAALSTMPMLQQQQPAAAEHPHRPRKAAKVNTSWDSCITEQGSPADSSSPTILSFGGHAAAAAAFAKAEPMHYAPNAAYFGAAKAPKQEVVDAAAAALPFQQPHPAKRSYDDMAAVAEAANKAPAAATTRPASQNQDHILAERKRREKLSERFIALSKIVPGLKKVGIDRHAQTKSMATCRRRARATSQPASSGQLTDLTALARRWTRHRCSATRSST